MTRKIVHIDMDAFYASVELRENPQLRGLPVVVAWDSIRSVVVAASYEARKYGLRSAMSVRRARELCPHAIYIAPNFMLYREVSRQVRSIFQQYTDRIEPLSLDEAYLDVTTNHKNIASATEVARRIREDIFLQTSLTASAGVAPNKFLAKIASDWNKPNGMCVIPPSKVQLFLQDLPLEKIPGVGRVTLAKFHRLQMKTVGDLRQRSEWELSYHFGRYGRRLYELARGIDLREVDGNQESQQVSTETTFDRDLPFAQLSAPLDAIAQKLWDQLLRKRKFGRTVTLKLKTASFRIVTRSQTYSNPLYSLDDVRQAAAMLLDRIELEKRSMLYRLIGLGVSTFAEVAEDELQMSLL
ncbi:DNA polymerase IV [Advenella kashmirensis W13003]|uniref:DNA polymerase IV n=1 Tax=Advenella kashmirensis W13003 TaxID=1424334 RepID=V8QRZ1_9BURK|nr:DNA polymerase IV [Advenella kashmirensis]ETF02070.1 DNA polymerase IV [Advenella kashmirensis W13003]